MFTAAPPVILWPNAAPPVPVLLDAGRTHVVGTRPGKDGGSELVEFKAGREPRLVASFKGAPGKPTIGTDRQRHTVVVVAGCLSGPKTHLPACPLSAVRLDTGAVTTIPGTTGAYVGDLDAGRVAFVRDSKLGARVMLQPKAGGKPRLASIDRITRLPDGSLGQDLASRRVTSFDLFHGTLALTVDYGEEVGGGSQVLQRRDGQGWQRLARSGYGEASGIPRVWASVQVRSSGVHGFYDGGDNDPSLAARWSPSGKLVTSLNLRKLRVPVVNEGSAFDGDRIVLSAFDGFECQAGDAEPPSDAVPLDPNRCAVASFGPLGLG